MGRLALDQEWLLEDRSRQSAKAIFQGLHLGHLQPTQLCIGEGFPRPVPLGFLFQRLGRYGLLDRLGAGAFGTVYLAFDIERMIEADESRLLALKRPNPEALRDLLGTTRSEGTGLGTTIGQIGQAFADEALLTARLAMCPSVVKVLDTDIATPFIAFEYCDGGALKERMRRPYRIRDVVQWGIDIASALAAAHGLEPDPLVHRDLKPANVLVSGERIKVSDFGTSKLLHQNESLRSLRGGFSISYAAPEAFDGKASTKTDTWSLGVILYELAAGRRPFNGSGHLRLITNIMSKDPEPLSEVLGPHLLSGRFSDLVAACLLKDPDDRPTTAECRTELQAVFEEIESQEGTTTHIGEDLQSARHLIEVYERLAGASLFSETPIEVLSQLVARAPVLEFEAGSELMRQDDQDATALLLLEGAVRVMASGQHVADRAPGDLLGELALLDGQPRSATVIAEQPTKALLIEGHDVDWLLERSPAFGKNVMRALTRKLRDSTRRQTGRLGSR